MAAPKTDLTGLGISEPRLCLDFINTEGEKRNPPPERLADLEIFLDWATDRGLCRVDEAAALAEGAPGDPKTVERFLARARELRETLFRVFTAARKEESPGSADLELLNRELAGAARDLHLVWENGEPRLALPRPWPSLESLLGPIAASAADLLRSPQLSRIKECAAGDCRAMFIDESKNRSRRWCDMSNCGNRAKARRFYRRHRQGN